jgi:hypothetical protein
LDALLAFAAVESAAEQDEERTAPRLLAKSLAYQARKD